MWWGGTGGTLGWGLEALGAGIWGTGKTGMKWGGASGGTEKEAGRLGLCLGALGWHTWNTGSGGRQRVDTGMGYTVTESTGSGLGALGRGMGSTGRDVEYWHGNWGHGEGYGGLRGVAWLWWAVGVMGTYGAPWGAMWLTGSYKGLQWDSAALGVRGELPGSMGGCGGAVGGLWRMMGVYEVL